MGGEEKGINQKEIKREGERRTWPVWKLGVRRTRVQSFEICRAWKKVDMQSVARGNSMLGEK